MTRSDRDWERWLETRRRDDEPGDLAEAIRDQTRGAIPLAPKVGTVERTLITVGLAVGVARLAAALFVLWQ